MSTGQMDNKTYDVIFVARKKAENKNAGMIRKMWTRQPPFASPKDIATVTKITKA